MSMRHDFNHDISDSINERRLQAEALAQLVANKAAQRELDRREAAADAMSDWARKAIAASKPAPEQGRQQAAQAAMMSRVAPGWAPPAPLKPQASPVFQPGGSAAAARELMMRRGGR